MTSIFRTPYGELQQFIQTLHSAGFKREDITRVNLNPVDAQRMYASIKDGQSAGSWYVSPECQAERAGQLWQDILLPEPPKDFRPATASEVLLLHVPRSFDELWDLIDMPRGCTKWRSKILKTVNRSLRFAPNKRVYTQPVWLAFDPEHGRGRRPDSLWGQDNLAASEVLSALIQFPKWMLTWDMDGVSAPNMSGYQFKHEAEWSHVPYLRWEEGYGLELGADPAEKDSAYWASPSVREC